MIKCQNPSYEVKVIVTIRSLLSLFACPEVITIIFGKFLNLMLFAVQGGQWRSVDQLRRGGCHRRRVLHGRPPLHHHHKVRDNQRLLTAGFLANMVHVFFT